jgi:WD40 repeat protein
VGLDDATIRFVDLYDAPNELNNARRQTSGLGERGGGEASGTPATFVGHTAAISCTALSVDGSLLVSGSLDGSVRVWDTFSGMASGVGGAESGV